MPLDPLHQRKKFKNMALYGAIIAFIALIWIITMVKISNGVF